MGKELGRDLDRSDRQPDGGGFKGETLRDSRGARPTC